MLIFIFALILLLIFHREPHIHRDTGDFTPHSARVELVASSTNNVTIRLVGVQASTGVGTLIPM